MKRPELIRLWALLAVVLTETAAGVGWLVLRSRPSSRNVVLISIDTCHADSVEDLAKEVGAVYCANVRGEFSFAVADAYRRWYDVDESEVLEILKRLGQKGAD